MNESLALLSAEDQSYQKVLTLITVCEQGVSRGLCCLSMSNYRASVSLISLRIVVVTEVPRESVIW